MKYINASKDALDQPAIENCTLSTQEIEAVIGFISEQLKEPMSNEERLMLVADRSELRATLKQRGGARTRGEKPMAKTKNQYAAILQRGRFFEVCPKAVFAALAVSYASRGGDFLEGVEKKVLKEWWILYQNGIVPQKPPMPEPENVEQG